MGNFTNPVIVVSEEIAIPNPAGLHARPAAVFASKAKTFQSDIKLLLGESRANAKSVVGVMGLSTRHGDIVKVEAVGDDAALAVLELTKLLQDACGEDIHEAQTIPASETSAPIPVIDKATQSVLIGVGAAPGIAVGRIFHQRIADCHVVEFAAPGSDEARELTQALSQASAQIEALKQQQEDGPRQTILAMHQELLQDPDLLALAHSGLTEGKSAAWSWKAAFLSYSARLEAQDNAFLRERANDIRDIGRRVLAILTGVHEPDIDIPPGSILIAEDMTPSDTATLDPNKVVGFCTRTGGATSHVAILARSLGIPAICGIAKEALTLPAGQQAIIDGSNGTLYSAPSTEQIRNAEDQIAKRTERRILESAQSHREGRTRDGTRIEVVANIRNAADARDAIKQGAEGVGLLRSEFLFDNRTTAPSEEEQAKEYCAVADALGKNRPLIIRTLDVGGDKPLSYLPLPKEDNPFLGLRGIRVGLAQPDLLRTQLRAILRSAPFTQLHIMFPMIASLDELREVKVILAEEQKAIKCSDVKIGIMVEVPSAAILAERFAPEVDFFSIGTNDLTQYVLAMDRGHPHLAKQADALHPAVLAMIAMTCAGARNHGRWVGVCGGLASDERAAPLLVGMGVTELSVSTPAIASIKAVLSRWSMDECRELAAAVLQKTTAAEIRELLAAKAL